MPHVNTPLNLMLDATETMSSKIIPAICMLICSSAFLIWDAASARQNIMAAVNGLEKNYIASDKSFEIQKGGFRSSPLKIIATHTSPPTGKLIYSLQPIEAGARITCIQSSNICFDDATSPFSFLPKSYKTGVYLHFELFVVAAFWVVFVLLFRLRGSK